MSLDPVAVTSDLPPSQDVTKKDTSDKDREKPYCRNVTGDWSTTTNEMKEILTPRVW